MKTMTYTLSILLAASTLAGCAGYGSPYGYSPYGQAFGRHQKALAGTAMGAAGGALLGGAMTQDADGAIVGGLLGGAAGGLVGHSMDQRPQPYYPAYQGGYQPYYSGGYGYQRHHHHDDDD